MDLDAIVVALQHRALTVPLLIGISGFGGAGKSTLARRLAQRLDRAQIVPIDDFWKPEADGLSADWDAFDRDRLEAQVLKPARAGLPVRYQRFDGRDGPVGDWRDVPPFRVLIVEGVSALHPNLRGYYDVTIWVECPLDLAVQRGMRRDRDEYGIDNDTLWRDHWAPNDRAYFEKYRPDRSAHWVVSTNETAADP